MSTLLDFTPVTEAVADERARVAVGRAGARKDTHYAVSSAPDGSILLTPLATIPARELIIWENAELRASLFRGLAEAAESRGRELPGLLDGVDPDTPVDDEDDA